MHPPPRASAGQNKLLVDYFKRFQALSGARKALQDERAALKSAQEALARNHAQVCAPAKVVSAGREWPVRRSHQSSDLLVATL